MKKSTILKGVVIGLGAIGTIALGVFGAKKYKESKAEEVKEPQTPREALEAEAEKIAEEVCMADEVETDEPKITKEVAIGGAIVAGVVGVGYLGYKAFKKFKGKDEESSLSDSSIDMDDILYTGYDDSYIDDDSTANNSVVEEGDATKDDVGGYNPHSEIKNIDIKDNTSDSFKK